MTLRTRLGGGGRFAVRASSVGHIALGYAASLRPGPARPDARQPHTQVIRQPLEMVGVANAIDPACGEWLETHTEMTALIEQRPVGE